MCVIELQQTKAATWATHHPCLMMINSRTVLAFNQWLKIRRSAGCVNLRKAAKRIKEDLLTPDGLMLSLECRNIKQTGISQRISLKLFYQYGACGLKRSQTFPKP